jgi:SAM-dependent methyltransferase
MNFSIEWDRVYRGNDQLSRWPWSDLVSYVYRCAKPSDGFWRVLELGCGAGANIPFFEALGVDYYGIEGSPSIVHLLHGQFPKIKDRIAVGDFTRTIPFDGTFDLIVDRSSITHNDTPAIGRTLGTIFSRLRSGGKLIGIDWFSMEHSDAKSGDVVDAWTRTNIPNGQFSAVGAVHFSDREHLRGLLRGSGFEIERLEHKLVDTVVPEGNNRFAAWNFVAVKP